MNPIILFEGTPVYTFVSTGMYVFNSYFNFRSHLQMFIEAYTLIAQIQVWPMQMKSKKRSKKSREKKKRCIFLSYIACTISVH